jgi:hypothetical protein
MRWRDPRRAGLLMWAYFLISVAVGSGISIRAGTGPSGPTGHLSGAIVSAFFAWRVTQGGRVSRTLLIVVTEIAFLATASQIASRFGWLVFGTLAAYAVQIALLLSPAVYLRTREPDWVPPAVWARLRPPLTLLLLGILVGLVVTLIGLGHLGDSPLSVPPCDIGGPPQVVCGTLAEGAPLRWLTVYHGAPAVSWAAMAKDWTEYAVISASVLYGFWLATRARNEPAGSRVPAAAVVGSALGGLTLTVVHELHRLLPALVLEEHDGPVAVLAEVPVDRRPDPFIGAVDHSPHHPLGWP